jgi:hypothetical protein
MLDPADRPMTKRNDVPVKIDAEVIKVAKIAAAYRELSLAEYLSERLRPLVAEDVQRSHAENPYFGKPKGAATGPAGPTAAEKSARRKAGGK